MCDFNLLTMRRFIYVKIPAYLQQWARKAYRVPGEEKAIEFPAIGNENAVIRRFLQRPPRAVLPEVEKESADLFLDEVRRTQHLSREMVERDEFERDFSEHREEYLPIVIPESKAKPAAEFNYLGPRGRAAVREVIVDLFKSNLWAELHDLCEQRSLRQATIISAWCELHGIDVDYEDSVKQVYYRIRAAHAKKGVNLINLTRIKKDLQ